MTPNLLDRLQSSNGHFERLYNGENELFLARTTQSRRDMQVGFPCYYVYYTWARREGILHVALLISNQTLSPRGSHLVSV